jgi:LysR family glycine cleavage system transcriptional activator
LKTKRAKDQCRRKRDEDQGSAADHDHRNLQIPCAANHRQRQQAGLKGAFSETNAALASMKTRRRDAEITVSLLPVMAARWLVPRLPVSGPGFRTSICVSRSVSRWRISNQTASTLQFGSGRAIGRDSGRSSFSMKSSSPCAAPASTGPSAKRSRLDVVAATAHRPQFVVARLVQVCRFKARSRYRRHLLYRYERADGGRGDGTGDCAGAPVVHTIGHSGGEAGSPVRTQPASSYCHYAVYPMASESNPALVAFRDWLVEETRRAY